MLLQQTRHHGAPASRMTARRWMGAFFVSAMLWRIATPTQAEITAPAFSEVAPHIERFGLDNGLPVSTVFVESDVAVTVFTILPAGLAWDPPGRALWSKLVERLSTQLVGESDGEVSPDRVVLTSWCPPDRWQDTLRAHAQMMRATVFDQTQLAAYQEHVIVETRWQEKHRDLGDVATALFAQGYRFARNHVPVKQDVQTATVTDALRYRDETWQVLKGARLCVIGPVPVEKLKPVITREFGSLASAQQHSPAVAPPRKSMAMTWDHETPLLVLAWPLAQASAAEMADLRIAISWLSDKWYQSGYAEQLGGVKIATFDRWPEGPLLVMALTMHVGAPFDEAVSALEAHVNRLGEGENYFAGLEVSKKSFSEAYELASVPMITGPQWTEYAPVAVFRRWLRSRRSWAEIEWLHGSQRRELADNFRRIVPRQIRDTARKYLTDEARIVCTIEPRPDRSE